MNKKPAELSQGGLDATHEVVDLIRLHPGGEWRRFELLRLGNNLTTKLLESHQADTLLSPCGRDDPAYQEIKVELLTNMARPLSVSPRKLLDAKYLWPTYKERGGAMPANINMREII